MLRSCIYTGNFVWNDKTYQGNHEPIVTRELWEKVQSVLDGRFSNRNRKPKRDFAFTGLIRCGHCGCSIVAELKKGRYVYYHCSRAKGVVLNPTSARRYWGSGSLQCSTGFVSTTKYWPECPKRYTSAIATRNNTTTTQCAGSRQITTVCRATSTLCTSISLTVELILNSSIGRRRSGVPPAV